MKLAQLSAEVQNLEYFHFDKWLAGTDAVGYCGSWAGPSSAALTQGQKGWVGNSESNTNHRVLPSPSALVLKQPKKDLPNRFITLTHLWCQLRLHIFENELKGVFYKFRNRGRKLKEEGLSVRALIWDFNLNQKINLHLRRKKIVLCSTLWHKGAL